jgi:ribosome-associated protein
MDDPIPAGSRGAVRPAARGAIPPGSPGAIPLGRQGAIPLGEVEIRASRSSGPGGQHANVTASRIEASFDVAASRSLTDEQKRRVIARLGPRVVAVAQDSRSQSRNRELALERLQRRLTSALTLPRARRATTPTRASKQKRLDAKRRQAERKRARRRPLDDGG